MSMGLVFASALLVLAGCAGGKFAESSSRQSASGREPASADARPADEEDAHPTSCLRGEDHDADAGDGDAAIPPELLKDGIWTDPSTMLRWTILGVRGGNQVGDADACAAEASSLPASVGGWRAPTAAEVTDAATRGLQAGLHAAGGPMSLIPEDLTSQVWGFAPISVIGPGGVAACQGELGSGSPAYLVCAAALACVTAEAPAAAKPEAASDAASAPETDGAHGSLGTKSATKTAPSRACG